MEAPLVLPRAVMVMGAMRYSSVVMTRSRSVTNDSYIDDANPYRPLLDKIAGFRAAPIPVGETATSLLAARKAAPEDAPFLTASLDW